ncbi:hypothetical protein [Microbacterium sp. A93]|uniref:hypothetical protein n=1 Tax=Microbacterium sp. A93 TaxID=3450716 RepID=UPI003F44241F
MEAPTGPPDRTAPVPEARSAVFTVIVERSGGIAGLLRRWTAEIPDDGHAAARAAHRIARRTGDDSTSTEGNPRSEEARNHPDPEEERAPSERRLRRGRSAARDGFQWAVSCGEGSLRCDEAERRRDPELDELIRTVTSAEEGSPDAS